MKENKSPMILERSNEFFNQQSRLVRCIIEGGYHDRWRTHTLATEIFELKDITDRILILDYEFDLVLKREENKMLIDYFDLPPKNPLEVEYSLFRGIERPCIIITEDGRIYYDKKLNEQKRIESLFSALEKKFPNKNFLEIYMEIGKKSKKG